MTTQTVSGSGFWLVSCGSRSASIARTSEQSRVSRSTWEDELTIELTVTADLDVELEVFTARERAGLLELALDKRVDFVVF